MRGSRLSRRDIGWRGVETDYISRGQSTGSVNASGGRIVISRRCGSEVGLIAGHGGMKQEQNSTYGLFVTRDAASFVHMLA